MSQPEPVELKTIKLPEDPQETIKRQERRIRGLQESLRYAVERAEVLQLELNGIRNTLDLTIEDAREKETSLEGCIEMLRADIEALRKAMLSRTEEFRQLTARCAVLMKERDNVQTGFAKELTLRMKYQNALMFIKEIIIPV